MRSGEPDQKKALSLAWAVIIGMLPFVILLFCLDSIPITKGFVYIANVSYYTIFIAWGWVAALIGSYLTNLSEKRGWVKFD